MPDKENWQRIILTLGQGTEADKKLNHYFEVVEELAMCFDINVVLTASSDALEPAATKDDRVYIHIDSLPDRFRQIGPTFPDIIFGHKVHYDLSLMEVDERAGEKSPSGFSIISPEGVRVGFVYPKHIYIYQGLLDPELWKYGEDQDILSIILYMVLPEAVAMGSDIRLSSHYFSAGYDNAKYLLRSKLQKDGYRKHLEFQFKNHTRKSFLFILEEMRIQLADLMKEGRDLAEKDYDVFKEIVETEETLKSVTVAIASRDFGLDFDQILRIDGVKCVRVITTQELKKIVIFTDSVEQIPGSLKSDHYDIGAFEILINPNYGANSEPRAGIAFSQARRKGKFSHRFISSTSVVCFGAALNPDLSKLMADFDIVPLIHLIMNFLVKESTAPEPNNNGGKVQTTENLFLKSDSYADSVDCETERKNFCDFMLEVLISKSLSGLESKLTDLSKKLGGIRVSRNQIRLRMAVQKKRIKDIEIEFGKIDPESVSQVSLLVAERQIFWITGQEDEILIYLSPPEIKKESLRSNRGFVLKIKRGEHAELLLPRNFESVEMTNSEIPRFVSKEMETSIMRYRIHGRFLDVFYVAQEIVARGLREKSNE